MGPLHGVPMTIKDSFDTEGVVSTGGTLGRRTFVPSRDATVVARVRAAGAILLGKTNTPETFASLIDDVEQRIFAELPDSTWVYPGHGNDTTLGAERPHLAEWRARGW